MAEKDEVIAAAKLIKEHCEKNNFYKSEDGLCHCVFVEGNACCPFETSSMPEEWEVPAE